MAKTPKAKVNAKVRRTPALKPKNRGGRPRKLTDKTSLGRARRKALLDAIRLYGHLGKTDAVEMAAAVVGVDPKTVTREMARDRSFAHAIGVCLKAFHAACLGTLFKAATEGFETEKRVVKSTPKGRELSVEKSRSAPSVTAALSYLARVNPEKFGPVSRPTLSPPLPVNPEPDRIVLEDIDVEAERERVRGEMLGAPDAAPEPRHE